MEFNNHQKALLYTLLYSDIFNFPLTEEELWLDLMNEKKIDMDTLRKTIKSLSKFISYKNGFFCLAGKEKIINKRRKRIKIAQKKIEIAISVGRCLSYIPTILFVGISGRLSHIDADRDDDIDIFIITKKNTIWSTRLFLLAVLELMRVRRIRNDKNPRDKICPNLIIEESALAWPMDKRDLYTAHEIVHIIPLFTRNNIFQEFLAENKWISKFYPNREGFFLQEQYIEKPKTYIIIKTLGFLLTLPIFEYIFDKLQRIYMKKGRKSEVVLSNFLAFHPYDYRQEILGNFSSKIKQYGLLTNG
ncbi:hypothetical protein KKE68_06195 [Patescibacteria group bacterium]|nr:hypothetical protein [Patescibacteria group bacterium]